MYKVVGAAFKENSRTYYFDINGFDIKIGDTVIVETEKGFQYAKIVTSVKEMAPDDLIFPLKQIIRITTKEDDLQYSKNITDASEAVEYAKKIADSLKLNMNIIDANYTFDRNQLLFNFLADDRVDFRELAKKLAQQFKTRIELRQIGVRDKAREVSGLGPCGRILCCSTFLTEFNSVSINMAKNQYISLNPIKINGVCGRLLCCLKYEDEVYTDLKKGLPSIGNIISTKDGKGKIVSINLFKKIITVDMKENGFVDYNFDEVLNGSNK